MSAAALEDCRHAAPQPAGRSTDGPGSFGRLHGTVTLGCLRYVGSILSGDQEWILIEDDRHEVHRLKVGDYIGENSGVIRAIDGDFIYIEQSVPLRGGAGHEPLMVKLPKTKGAPGSHR